VTEGKRKLLKIATVAGLAIFITFPIWGTILFVWMDHRQSARRKVADERRQAAQIAALTAEAARRPDAAPPPRPRLERFAGGRPCFLDVNGDHIDDLITSASYDGGATALAALDGATGKLIWHVDGAPAGDLTCADGVILDAPRTFRLLVYASADGKQLAEDALSDRAASFAWPAPGKVAVTAADGVATTLDVPWRGAPPAVLPDSSAKSATWNGGETTIALSRKLAGTPVVVVTATVGTRKLWSTMLDGTAYDLRAGASDAAVVVAVAIDPLEGRGPCVQILSITDGSRRARACDFPGQIDDLHTEGRHVFVVLGPSSDVRVLDLDGKPAADWTLDAP
jgi:hypothetical protein